LQLLVERPRTGAAHSSPTPVERAPETMQALVKVLWSDHVEFDAEHDALRSANKQESRPLGVHPAPFKPTPLSIQTGPPPPQTGTRRRRSRRNVPVGWAAGPKAPRARLLTPFAIVAEIGMPRFSRSGERPGLACVVRDYFCSLLPESSTPCVRTYANHLCENSRKVTLVAEAGGRGQIGERKPPVAQHFLCHLDAALHEPSVRCHSYGTAKRARKMGP
jgi:hypothetical protein